MTLTEANSLIEKYIKLKNKALRVSSKENVNEFLKHERICLDKFKYIILMKTAKYKQFPNYDDLNQEALDALLLSFNSFDPSKGSIFWWIHKYVDTRVARSVRFHTVIKFPMRLVRNMAPQRLALPVLIDNLGTPDTIFECKETWSIIKKTVSKLSVKQRQIVNMALGIDEDGPQSVSNISLKMKLSKVACERMLSRALKMIKQEIA